MSVLHDHSSDHDPVVVTVGEQHMNKIIKLGYDYNKADWKTFKQQLNQNIVINSKIDTEELIEKEVEKYTDSPECHKQKHSYKKHRSTRNGNTGIHQAVDNKQKQDPKKMAENRNKLLQTTNE